MMRYLRAFVGALKMTLRGEAPPPAPTSPLREWMGETLRRTDALLKACEASGMDEAARKAVVQVVEGRRVNLNTVLLTIRFHAAQEYPTLLSSVNNQALGALYGSNTNDHFLLMRFLSRLDKPEIVAAAQALIEHLASVPSVDSV
ncbi:MAG: hypothetical protein MUF38_04515 [Anaerolineae bacterium]|nr:hypothetical protein [Anaerolineae bacterium]